MNGDAGRRRWQVLHDAIAGRADQPELVVVALMNVTQKVVLQCLHKIDPNVAVRWLTKDVAAVAASADLLAALTAGGFSKDASLVSLVRKVSVDGPSWMVIKKTKVIADGAATMSAAYGTVTLKPPTMNVELHVIVDSEKGASATAAFAMNKLKETEKHLPTAAPDALVHIKARARGSEVVIGGPFPEKDFLSLVMTFAIAP